MAVILSVDERKVLTRVGIRLGYLSGTGRRAGTKDKYQVEVEKSSLAGRVIVAGTKIYGG